MGVRYGFLVSISMVGLLASASDTKGLPPLHLVQQNCELVFVEGHSQRAHPAQIEETLLHTLGLENIRIQSIKAPPLMSTTGEDQLRELLTRQEPVSRDPSILRGSYVLYYLSGKDSEGPVAEIRFAPHALLFYAEVVFASSLTQGRTLSLRAWEKSIRAPAVYSDPVRRIEYAEGKIRLSTEEDLLLHELIDESNEGVHTLSAPEVRDWILATAEKAARSELGSITPTLALQTLKERVDSGQILLPTNLNLLLQANRIYYQLAVPRIRDDFMLSFAGVGSWVRAEYDQAFLERMEALGYSREETLWAITTFESLH